MKTPESVAKNITENLKAARKGGNQRSQADAQNSYQLTHQEYLDFHRMDLLRRARIKIRHKYGDAADARAAAEADQIEARLRSKIGEMRLRGMKTNVSLQPGFVPTYDNVIDAVVEEFKK